MVAPNKKSILFWKLLVCSLAWDALIVAINAKFSMNFLSYCIHTVEHFQDCAELVFVCIVCVTYFCDNLKSLRLYFFSILKHLKSQPNKKINAKFFGILTTLYQIRSNYFHSIDKITFFLRHKKRLQAFIKKKPSYIST